MFVFGVQLFRDRVNRILVLYQTKYINEILRRFNLDSVKSVGISGVVGFKFISEQCSKDDEDVQVMVDVFYRYAVGCLNYIVCWIRSDI